MILIERTINIFMIFHNIEIPMAGTTDHYQTSKLITGLVSRALFRTAKTLNAKPYIFTVNDRKIHTKGP